MFNIADYNSIIIFIGFVLPGFIFLKFYQLFLPNAVIETSKQIIDAVAYSCINYSVLIIPIYLIESTNISETSPIGYSAFYFFVLLIAPILLALCWIKIRKTKIFLNLMPHPTLMPWDKLFSDRKPYWVRVNLKDGTIVAGLYGENSFTSSFPGHPQIYLEEEWVLNSDLGFERKAENSDGVIVVTPDIVSIELIEYGE